MLSSSIHYFGAFDKIACDTYRYYLDIPNLKNTNKSSLKFKLTDKNTKDVKISKIECHITNSLCKLTRVNATIWTSLELFQFY